MKISKEKRSKISEHVLAFLFTNIPKAIFTSDIAKEVARDEEFIKKILVELKKKDIITEIKKNSEGKPYLRRSRWKLTDSAYLVYKNKQL